MSSSAWVVCFVSIRFDIDIGPIIENISPPDALSEEGKRVITQVAFPDCNPESGHDLIFFFHMKDCTLATERSQAESVASPQTSLNVSNIYGATYYRQKRDVSVPRGYVQQAFVLLSRLPYMLVHELILRVVVPRLCQCCALSPDTEKVPVLSALSPIPTTYFEVDSSFNPSQYSQAEVLERAVEEIEGWPTPHPHVQYNLMLLCQPFSFVTPGRCLRQVGVKDNVSLHRLVMHLDDRVAFLGSKRQSSNANDAIPLYALLNEHLRHLTQIWELLLCHESIFIWSNTPSMASAVAFALASLVLPLEYNGILRSYLTVQDESFSRFSRMGKAIPFPLTESIIVAATNPFFFRAFDGWRNLLTVIDRQARSTGSARTMGDSCNDSTFSIIASASVSSFNLSSGAILGNGSPNTNNTNTSNNTPTLSSINGSEIIVSSTQRSNSNSRISNSTRRNRFQPNIQRVFTYSNFFPALNAAKRSLPTNIDSSSGINGGGNGGGDASLLQKNQGVSIFKSSFPFLVDHKAQTAILLYRLEQASRLNAEAQLASLNAHTWNGCGNLEEVSNIDRKDSINSDLSSSNIQSFSQYSIADDIVRKFFVTLTMEFLMPINAWFQSITNTLSVFHLCDPATITNLTPDSFLNFLKENRSTVPSFLSRHPYKTYNVMYERFAKGSLFRAVLWQLVDKKIRQGLEDLHVEAWAAHYPAEAERINMFINLYRLVKCEVTQSIDPDVVFVTMAISVLAGMATYISEPLRDQLMHQVHELKL